MLKKILQLILISTIIFNFFNEFFFSQISLISFLIPTQVQAEIWVQLTEADLEQAQKNIAKADLEQAQKNIAKADLEQAQKNIAKADLKQAEENLAKAQIYKESLLYNATKLQKAQAELEIAKAQAEVNKKKEIYNNAVDDSGFNDQEYIDQDRIDEAQEKVENIAKADLQQAEENLAKAQMDKNSLPDSATELQKTQAELDAAKAKAKFNETNERHDIIVNNQKRNEQKSNEQKSIDKDRIKKAQNEYNEAYTNHCKKTWNCIDKSSFKINVNHISPWIKVDAWAWSTETINIVFGIFIQKMMIALGSLSILIMTIGAGYMVIYSWQDELLSKWKSIFMSWIYAMTIALSSYYIISIIRWILY